MDAAGLTVLMAELEADSAVLANAASKAAQRIAETNPGHLEACAYELARVYNVFEQILERICQACENHFEKRGDYHEKLIQRLSLNLKGIRPAFIPAERVADIRELKGFRHVMRHAYDLSLRPDRLAELAAIAGRLAAELPAWRGEFAQKIRQEQGWAF
jgi:hypothetical protein